MMSIATSGGVNVLYEPGYCRVENKGKAPITVGGGRYHPWRKHAWSAGCWCSSWRETKNGLRIWRRGAWRKPEVREVRRSHDA